MELGLCILPTDRWAVARDQWRFAEEAGYATAWTYDHLVWGGMPEGPWHATFPVLAAAAGVTGRIRLGTLITSPNFRHPYPLARDAITLDDLSEGRFDLGLGAGSDGPDAAVLGRDPWPAGERRDRFAEFVELLDDLLTASSPVTSAVGHYAAVGAVTAPGCRQAPRVPFTVAATGPSGQALAARFGQSWVTLWDPADGHGRLSEGQVRRQVDGLAAACAATGRDPASLRRVLLSMATTPIGSEAELLDVAGRFGGLGFDQLVLHHPAQTGPFGQGDLDRYGRFPELVAS